MRRLILSAFLAAIPMVIAATSPGTDAVAPQNPYAAIYEKNIAGLGQPDQTLDSVLPADAELAPFDVETVGAQSKTCSQRCSTTCSRSCTTTRGCSSNCKRQTDGCGGTTVPAPRPATGAPTTSSGVTSSNAATTPRVVYLADGTAVYHASLQCSALRGAKGLVARPLTAVGDGFEPCSVCGAPIRVAAGPPAGSAPASPSAVPVERADATFSLGATQATVRAIQGSPRALVGDNWQYGDSIVYFRNGVVVGYSNRSGNLKVSLGSITAPSAYFSVGSTREEVLAIHGTPTAVVGDSWHYDYSVVSFQVGRVESVSNISGNLRVK